MTTENNKIIAEFMNYSISKEGFVTNIKTNRVLKPSKSIYLSVTLRLNNKSYQRTIHRLVATYFINNIHNKNEVNHIDGNKHNNNVNNLEWVTSSENKHHAYDTGLNIPSEQLKEKRRQARTGYNTPQSTKDKIQKSLSKKVICINNGKVFNSLKDAVKYANIPKTTFHRKFHKGQSINGNEYKWYNEQKKE